MNGYILDIKRMSVHDGPGLRTSIFMKGCPLHCRWCHNPESISPKSEIGFLKRKCISCRKCANVCHAGAHIFQDGSHIFRHELCTSCGKCVDLCLSGAMEIYGKEISPSDAAAAVLEDKTFYEKSGGGCTISGGEPLLQAQFCAELFRILQSNGIHCAIDSSGAVRWQNIEKVIPYTSLFLYDLKHTDEKRHKEYTGVSNRRIIDNLKRLSKYGIPIEIRIPAIPEFNLNDTNMCKTGKLLSPLRNISGVRLLPFHSAHAKFEAVGHRNLMCKTRIPSQDDIEKAALCLKRFGLTIL